MNAIQTLSTLVAGSILAVLAPLAPARAGECGASGPNLRPARLASVGNYNVADGVDALTFGIDVCNTGDVPIAVQASTSQHYVVTQNLFRLKDHGGWQAFEQVGQAWVFHTFCALAQTTCCTCVGPTVCNLLQPGCSSPDTANIVGSRFRLGPRAEVNALTGAFAFPSSDPAGPDHYRRIAVDPADLESTATTTTRYFGELVGLASEDAAAGHAADNAAWCEALVSIAAGNASVSLNGPTAAGVAALHAWKAADGAVEIREVQLAGEGRLVLAWRVTDLGGLWHYEYALYNLSSNDSIGSFALPLSAGVALQNAGFHDVVYRGGDGIGGVDRDGADWGQKLEGGHVVWSATDFAQDPNANALRWGTLYNFRFDAPTPPTIGTLRLGRFESGATELVPGVAVPSALSAPGLAYCDASDGALALCPCGNVGSPDTGCDNAQATGGVSLEATLFAPNGSGGGSATFVAAGFPLGSTPGAVLMRASARDLTPPVFGDGVLCLELAGLVRAASGLAANGSLALSVSHGAGSGSFEYQVWYRNLPASFCTPAGFNLSSAYELAW